MKVRVEVKERETPWKERGQKMDVFEVRWNRIPVNSGLVMIL